ncbi:MAG: altronate dehydratase [Clostridia bacterium]|nr:altronate dehydratase [Clostridia bacterium]
MNVLKIHEKDNVAVALTAAVAGERIALDGSEITLAEDIPAGHKVALREISEGENVIKYGFPIGHAKEKIAAGHHVHTHNLASNLSGLLSYEYTPNYTELEKTVPGTFMGYKRKDGKVGIRNEVWIVPTVGCVNSIAKEIEDRSKDLARGSVEGVFSYAHPYGCSQLGEDHQNTQKALCGLINHPNAGAVLVLCLGCENNTAQQMKAMLGDYDTERIRFLVCQEVEDEITEGVKIVSELCDYASQFEREECTADKLIIGLKCGGSDGFSGITANPLVGSFSDKLISGGGSTILTEVPEMFGAETILMNRCRTKEVFDDCVALINNFKEYFRRHGEKINENPSPGNKAGGISTLEDKSLGCTQKGGTAVVEDVLSYGQPVQKNGLSLLQAPGNDLVASLSLAISGAHMVLFTTGRGTPFGCPVPTVKISSNTRLFEHKSGWIDFNAGELAQGKSMETLTNEFYDFIMSVASGEKTKSERMDKRDLAIFKDGVTL